MTDTPNRPRRWIARHRGLTLSTVAAAVAAAVTVTLVGTAGAEPPKVPEFTAAADAYQEEDQQTTCDPTPKPGVVDFRDLILEHYPDTSDAGIGRDCTPESIKKIDHYQGDTSEHYEGRAWDWRVDAATQKDQAEEVFEWLLAERDGEAHALLRRLGIMYIIFDKKILGSYRIDEGWRDYNGSNPHTDHVHFSFGWDGADQATTWWTARGEPTFCEQANLDFEAYPDLKEGAAGDEVTAAQCLLDKAGRPVGEGDPSGEYDKAMAESVTGLQKDLGLKETGEIDSHTWTALLARGSNVQIKEGAEGPNVSRLQRALTAALGTAVTIDGKFTAATTKAAKEYQEKAGLDADGIVGPKTWTALRTGV